jgi:hypothetical protein
MGVIQPMVENLGQVPYGHFMMQAFPQQILKSFLRIMQFLSKCLGKCGDGMPMALVLPMGKNFCRNSILSSSQVLMGHPMVLNQ